MDQYESSYPPTPEVPSSLRLFFKTFYKISDTPEAHEKYVGCFTKDAVLVMASAKVEGSDGKEVSSLITNCSTCIPYRKGACSKGLKPAFVLCCILCLLLTHAKHQESSPSARTCGRQSRPVPTTRQRFSPLLRCRSLRRRSCSTVL